MNRSILFSIGPSLAITLATLFAGGCLGESAEDLAMSEEDKGGGAAELVGETSLAVVAQPTASATGTASINASTSGVGLGSPVPYCSGWTQWYDHDDPTAWGDSELRADQIPAVCAKPTGVECKTLSGVDWTQTGEDVVCNPQTGFYCKNVHPNDGSCQDYKVRFCCGKSTL